MFLESLSFPGLLWLWLCLPLGPGVYFSPLNASDLGLLCFKKIKNKKIKKIY
jgi:hypothetical protein